MLDFKITRLDNVKFNIEELIEYYYTLERDFQHFKWDKSLIRNEAQRSGVSSYTGDGLNLNWYGWAIQTSANPTHHECPWRVGASEDSVENAEITTCSALVFGFAQKLIDNLPSIAQLALVVHPVGGQLVMHCDDDPEEYSRAVIQIPILTNDSAYWQTSEGDTVLQAGYAYLVDTIEPHGTHNKGNTPRIHLKCSIHIDDVDKLVNLGFDIC